MSLVEDLEQSIISRQKIDQQNINAVFSFKKELELFKGHFPGNPILPGIVQIEMVKYAIEKSYDQTFSIKTIKKTKFSNLIHPDTMVSLDITIKEEANMFNVKAIVKVDNSVAGKLNLVLL